MSTDGCAMNTGMDLTFDILATTRNEAAVDMLVTSLEAGGQRIRCRAIDALLRRGCRAGAMQVLRRWRTLSDAELRAVQEHPAEMQSVVGEVLAGSVEHPLWDAAIDALRMLNLTAVLPAVIDRAEVSGERCGRTQLLAATIELCSALGSAARRGREDRAQRMPVVRRLAESVRRFEFHRCDGLCDAFLAVSRWSDAELRVLLDEGSRTARWLGASLTRSQLPAVVQLAAGFIRRRHIPEVVRQAIRVRGDDGFRDQLLRVVGSRPSATTLRNLRTIGSLACLNDSDSLVGRTPPGLHAALAHAHTANSSDALRQLGVNLDVLARGSRDADAAVAQSLGCCMRLDDAELVRAAGLVARGDHEVMQRNPTALLLRRILQLFDHPSPPVVEALRKVLRPLHIDRFLQSVESMGGRQSEPLGRLIRHVNPAAVEQLADELRHPVLNRRLAAIEAAIVCDLLTPLEPLLLHAVAHDYREAQLRATKALGYATSVDSLQVLRSLAHGPVGALRDAAREALAVRAAEVGGAK